ncbi:MAG: hypothetical protein QXR60_03835 [Candidatus Nanoarchaeia archaeon]
MLTPQKNEQNQYSIPPPRQANPKNVTFNDLSLGLKIFVITGSIIFSLYIIVFLTGLIMAITQR